MATAPGWNPGGASGPWRIIPAALRACYLNPVPIKDRAAYNAYMAEYMLRRYHKRRAEALALLGGKCVVCGTTEDLNFDHIDRDTKSFSISRLWSISYNRFLAEVQKCQILCQAHHIEKSKAAGDFSRRTSASVAEMV